MVLKKPFPYPNWIPAENVTAQAARRAQPLRPVHNVRDQVSLYRARVFLKSKQPVRIVKDPCRKCRGAGRVEITRKVQVKIPAGVDVGSKLRLSGEGEGSPSPEGQPGDLYVVINVKAHKFFQRDNTDIICAIDISFIQAALGDEIKIPTLVGEEKLKIPKGTQYGDVFRLRGEGIASLRTGRRGDQIIKVIIKTPTKLNQKQVKLLKEFDKLDSNKISNKLKNLFKNL